MPYQLGCPHNTVHVESRDSSPRNTLRFLDKGLLLQPAKSASPPSLSLTRVLANMSQPHPCPSPCLFLSIFLLSNLALSLLISPAHAQLLEKQTKLIGTLVQNNVFSGSTNFDSIQLELSKDDVRELDENDEWTMLAELGTFGYCTIQTQQARLTSIRRVSYQVNVKVVGASLENDTTPRVWYPVIDRLGESDPMKKDFRRCVLPGEKEVVVGENRLDFAKLTGYEKRKNAANALVKKKSAPFVGISTFADSCHEFKSRQIWTPCSRVASELEEKKAVEGVVEPPLRNVIPVRHWSPCFWSRSSLLFIISF